MTITDAERQILISLIELCEPIETPNNNHYSFYPKDLQEAAKYFLDQRADWQPAYPSLAQRGFIVRSGETWVLSDDGRAAARQERLDHPPIWYWYRQYYTLTKDSLAYSRFCAELYGRDLCQTNFSGMDQLDFMIQVADLRPGQCVLELGCGRGLFAEYLSDQTGARVWGVDYVPEAIQQALERTQSKRDRLVFSIENFDHLNFTGDRFDLITSIAPFTCQTICLTPWLALKKCLRPVGRCWSTTRLCVLTQLRHVKS